MPRVRVIRSNPEVPAKVLTAALVAATDLEAAEADLLVRTFINAPTEVSGPSMHEHRLRQIAAVLETHGYEVAFEGNSIASTAGLRLLREGKYVAYGSYSLSEDPTTRRPLESFFALSHTELLLVFEGSFSKPDGPTHGFKLEVELPAKEVGKGYFLFQYQSTSEIKGVVGTTPDAFLLAGRSKEPPMQLAAHLTLIDENHMSMQGLVAYEDFKWVTWTISVKTYDPQLAKASVMSLPRRA